MCRHQLFGFFHPHPHDQWQPIHCYTLNNDNRISNIYKAANSFGVTKQVFHYTMHWNAEKGETDETYKRSFKIMLTSKFIQCNQAIAICESFSFHVRVGLVLYRKSLQVRPIHELLLLVSICLKRVAESPGKPVVVCSIQEEAVQIDSLSFQDSQVFGQIPPMLFAVSQVKKNTISQTDADWGKNSKTLSRLLGISKIPQQLPVFLVDRQADIATSYLEC